MSHGKVSRREFLLRTSAATASLPLLPLLTPLPARAATGVPPLRLICVYSLYQIPEVFYHPQVSATNTAMAPAGSSFNLNFPNSVLAPLAPFQSDLIIFRGLKYGQNPNSHGSFPNTFSGLKMDIPASAPPSISGSTIEHYLFSRMAKTGSLTPFLAGPFAYHCDNPDDGSPSFNNGVILSAMSNPRKLYDTLFANFMQPGMQTTAAAAAVNRRLASLGLIQKSLNGLMGQLPDASASHSVLKTHLAAAQGLAGQLGSSSATGASCAPPVQSSITDYSTVDYPGCMNGPALNASQIFGDVFKVITQALACDIVRFCSIRLGDGPDGQDGVQTIVNQMPGLENYTASTDPNDFHNNVTHMTTGEATNQADITLALYKRYYMSQVANLLTALKAISDPYSPTQSLYDNTVVLIGSEGSIQGQYFDNGGGAYTSDGHGNDDVHCDKPFVIAGGCGGYFKKGQLVIAGGSVQTNINHNALLTNIINTFETNQQQFNPAYVPKILSQYGDYSFSVSPTTWLT
jgi:hypothetical protein